MQLPLHQQGREINAVSCPPSKLRTTASFCCNLPSQGELGCPALGQKQTYAAQQVISALLPIATAKADICASSCPLYPQKQTYAAQTGMSGLGQKQTLAPLTFVIV